MTAMALYVPRESTTPDVSSPSRYLGVILPIVLVLVVAPLLVAVIRHFQNRKLQRRRDPSTMSIFSTTETLSSLEGTPLPITPSNAPGAPPDRRSIIHVIENTKEVRLSVPTRSAQWPLPSTPQWPLKPLAQTESGEAHN